MPCAQSAWLSLGSRRTSAVPIAFWANSTTDLTAQGARFLKERPWTRLCRWMVYSRVTTSWRAERVLPIYVCGYASFRQGGRYGTDEEVRRDKDMADEDIV